MSKNAVMVYSALGHAYFHMFTAFYFVIILSLEIEWRQPYHELIKLWLPAALLVGAFAIVAGWLGDRWSARGMLVVYFLGMGLSSIAAGYAHDPLSMMMALSGIGLFAAIYHPVGIPLVIRNSTVNQGMALAINGIFGGLGAALAGVVTGYLVQLGGSFLAFVLPGTIVVATGIMMLLGAGGGLPDSQFTDRREMTSTDNIGWRAPFFILLFCLSAAGLIYHTTQTVMPKVFSIRLGHGNGIDLKTVGLYIALVYTASGLYQLVGGMLADRYDLKLVYLGQFFLHSLLLVAAAYTAGLYLVVVLCMAVSLGSGALPAENMLLARHTPSNHHGLAFGLKFVLFFGSGPLAVVLVSRVNQQTGQFVWVFLLLAMIAAAIFLAALALPRRAPRIST